MSRINTNISSFQAITRLNKNQSELATRLERLSTGLQINRGKDAPAGLIASENLRSEAAGIKQAIDNSQRATNVINTAEGALAEVSALLLQLQSLTNQAANTGGLSVEEIRANQLQVDSILTSVNRISNTTQFNGLKLLNGSLDYRTSGVASAAIDAFVIHSSKIPDNGYEIVTVEVTGSATAGEVDYSGATIGVSAVTVEIGGSVGFEQLSFAPNTGTSAVAYAINNLKSATGVSAIVSGSTLRLTSADLGASQFVSVKTLSGDFINGSDYGTNARVNINGSEAQTEGVIASLRTSNTDLELRLDRSFAQTVNGTTSFTITGGGSKFQIGSTVNRPGQINVGIGSVSTSRLGDAVVGFLSDVGTGGDFSLVSGNTVQAQKIITRAIGQVATLRGRLGALQKDVLDTNVNSLSTALENVTASESTIRDADFASETALLTRAQILVQANTSILAQANATPQSVLALLQR